MMSRHALSAALAIPLFTLGLVASCSGSGGTGGSAGGGASTSTGSASGGGGQGGTFDTDGGSGEVCEPPDVLVLLDRTLTMHKTPEGNTPADGPDYKTSKWYQAITAVEALAAPPLDKGVRFGLALWPRDPGGGQCITLAERVLDTKQATNPACESAEIVVPPAVGSGAAIKEYLDPATTRLCTTTPTGNAMSSAIDYLKTIAVPGREQYIVLVTDGADWDQSCPDPNPMPIVQAAAAAGIKTYVVGFSASGDIQPGGVGGEFLNNMACAGQTAKGFPAPCAESAGGWAATDPKGAPLYLKAGNAVELGLALKAIGGKLCCDCEDACDPPEFLFALDRTLTMHKTPEGNTPADAPDYKTSKWHQAITAIEKVVAPPRDQTIRFGLELWPRDPGGGQCITLAERVLDTKQATNPFCQDGEIIVPPKLGAGAEIQNYLDPATTPICISTPTGSGLLTATSHLLGNAVPGRDQYVVLVTDGADWDQSCPDPNPLPIVQELAAGGIRTFVVGFSAEGAIQPGGVGAGFLNDLACAGQTADGFPANCKQTAGGYIAADPGGPLLYLKAGNASELDSALQAVTGGLCCDCIK
ncbi:vWA domain-containing protein [Polyangium aurulentum]|uniref:vWA domain-containing protein n=1 Tax=Polyangium aurulentum TaxID=2567896 RepID=UPI0010AE5B13|nr:vWA domain-containing protein [Polyangium aurulentum]UQA58622.1 VWA domain-containing protein [Polyangium aurulentum]